MPRLVRFGAFEMNLKTGELRKRGVTVKLQEQPFRVLAMLVERAGDLVTRDELRATLWPEHVFVDFEHNLNKAIAKVRQALGDLAESPRYVETLERRGYRFIAPVEYIQDTRATSAIASGAPSSCRIVLAGRAVPLVHGMNIIGREPDAAVFIDSTKVSRRHALVAVSDDGATLSDLGSKNGTFVNAQRVSVPVMLSDGDEITVSSAVPGGRLTPLQQRILRALAGLEPPWTLTGGGALAGVYLGHRLTRDLDFFWRNRHELGPLIRDAVTVMRADGLDVQMLRTTPTLAQLRVADGPDVCVVDLVAEASGPLEPPQRGEIAGVSLAVDSLHEILVNMLTALLSRSELRDLVDVKAILEAGGDLDRALADAPKKDGGFSALTLAWVLKEFAVGPLARALGWGDAECGELMAFKHQLVDRLVAGAAPE